MDRLCKEYIELLESDADPADKFWELDERIKKDRKKAGVQVEMKRSKLIDNLISLISEGVISLNDLKGFSDELKDVMEFLFGERIT